MVSHGGMAVVCRHRGGRVAVVVSEEIAMPTKNRLFQRRANKKWRDRMAATGLCCTCANPTNGFRLCNPCRVEDASRKREKRAALKALP
jgi:hypothetical protein